jgi:hypothetical protein
MGQKHCEYLLADHSLTAFSKSTCLNNGFVLSAASASAGIGFSQSGGFSLPTQGRQYSVSPFTIDEPAGTTAGATAVAAACPSTCCCGAA